MIEKDQIQTLKAISHPIRLEILRYLRDGASCATLANKAFPISQPNLSQHLKALKDAGIIDFAKRGTKRCFYICKPTLISPLLELLESEHDTIVRSSDELAEEIKSLRIN